MQELRRVGTPEQSGEGDLTARGFEQIFAADDVRDTLIEIVDGLSGSETLATSNLNKLSAGVAVSTQRGTR